MAKLTPDTYGAHNALLNYISSNAENLVICSDEPANYAAVAGLTLGTKTSVVVSGTAAGDVSGRKVTVSSFTNGSVSGNGTASHWAIVDVTGTELLAAGPLASSQSVTNGNTFTLTAFDIELPDPT